MLPIDMEILQKRKEIPKKIAALSYKDEKKAIHYLRVWGEKKSPISVLHKDLTDSLEEVAE